MWRAIDGADGSILDNWASFSLNSIKWGGTREALRMEDGSKQISLNFWLCSLYLDVFLYGLWRFATCTSTVAVRHGNREPLALTRPLTATLTSRLVLKEQANKTQNLTTTSCIKPVMLLLHTITTIYLGQEPILFKLRDIWLCECSRMRWLRLLVSLSVATRNGSFTVN